MKLNGQVIPGPKEPTALCLMAALAIPDKAITAKVQDDEIAEWRGPRFLEIRFVSLAVTCSNTPPIIDGKRQAASAGTLAVPFAKPEERIR